jgi:N-methylhydantoinase B
LARLEDGETIISVTCGGGGYGPPSERNPELVLEDVVEGWITRERAREVYGVAVSYELRLDATATSTLRANMPSEEADNRELPTITPS